MTEGSHICVFCGEGFNINKTTHAFDDFYFSSSNGLHSYGKFGMVKFPLINVDIKNFPNLISMEWFLCPTCHKTQFIIRGIGQDFEHTNKEIMKFPLSNHKNYSSEVVPEQIKEDYEEACSIVSLSPKSSATLSRRIIEEVLTDFFKITKGRLVDKIRELDKSEKSPDVIDELNDIRQIGNIATHFSYDKNMIPKKVSTDEAKIMIQAVEYIIGDTYITRDKRKKHREKMNNMLSKMKK
ncbi:DUF4145 domain-containing protein [Apilactobacillus timberlakei]|uniref:DUF4145 domain-containing protein n=1 Tax=Apilactobacillus timberlakei TaxID=2008380 RepID=UPI0011277C3C|nr:DUF4145 domain-containing protein [Apilactobacillus timberlakei]TPR19961.1 DUF4145 domain-containing protein [Apilactobacillus timberlakei]TPR21679.1 DUF4145 domain-containing protein [Apilactobacillus timberlakei]TPR22925.1 DUF4145 domain-containing protein [Apilactobacillus timberlakei]